MTPQPGDLIAVWFSCGAASACAAKLVMNLYHPQCDVRIINSPVLEEHHDNVRFRADVANWLQHPIELATNPKYEPLGNRCHDVWVDRQFMSSPGGAPCTLELKKKPRQLWENLHGPVDWHVLGFTVEEQNRLDRFRLTERENTLAPLVDAELTKQDCISWLVDEGLEVPMMYRLGYPNANCIGCVKATSPTYWNKVRRDFPTVFQRRAELSRQIGVRLARHKGERVFLDELPEDAKGYSIKSMKIECGIFCEEDDNE